MQIARGRGAPHSDVLDLADYLADQCETVRGDEGRALTWFLLLLRAFPPFLRAPNVPIELYSEPTSMAVNIETIGNILEDFEAEMQKVWKDITCLLKGEIFVLENDSCLQSKLWAGQESKDIFTDGSFVSFRKSKDTD